MSGAGRLLGWLAVPLLLGVYGYRAYTGIPAGLAYARANLEVWYRDYSSAVTEFQRSALGFNVFESHNRAGAAAIDIWEREAGLGGPMGASQELLESAARDYMAATCAAPASHEPWAGLALVHHKLEWSDRLRRGETGVPPPTESWEQVGLPGRLAIGFARLGIEFAPHWYIHRDWMVATLWTLGLEQAAREAIRDSARALPLFFGHEYRNSEFLNEWVVDDFITTSREMVGQLPKIDVATHRVELGRLEIRRGRYDNAIGDLERALEEPLDRLREAEARFHLGIALMESGRIEAGTESLEAARKHPVFAVSALSNLATYAEKDGDFERAVRYLRALRRQDSQNVDHCLRFARAAEQLGETAAVLEALRWARLIDRGDPRPLVQLAESLARSGDLGGARQVLSDLHLLVGEQDPELRRLRRRWGLPGPGS